MLGLNLVYFIVVWNWQPYHEKVNFHNRALKLNHFTAFFFTLTCELFNRASISQLIAVLLVYASLVLLLIVSICAFARLYVEYKFRKTLEDDPTLLDQKKKVEEPEMGEEIHKLSKRERLLLNNKYTLDSQIRDMWKMNNIALE